MATLINTWYGSWAGPNSSNHHRVRIQLYKDADTGSGYTMHWVWSVQIVRNTGSTYIDSSWTSSRYYANGTVNGYFLTTTGAQFTKTYGSSCSTTGKAWYESDTYGTTFTSTANASYTVPKPTYTISYNANNGLNAPSSQTKTYGTNLTLSLEVPTREGYQFKGWSTSSTATTATYQPGGTFTTNANTVLYAVWAIVEINSKITSLVLERCLQDGTLDTNGKYIKTTINYLADTSQDSTNVIVRLKWILSNGESQILNVNELEGSINIINENILSLKKNYIIQVIITDNTTDDNSEEFETYSDKLSKTLYLDTITKIHIKNWYNTEISEYGDSLISFPATLEEGLELEQVYGITEENLNSSYTVKLQSNNIENNNILTIKGKSIQNGTPTTTDPIEIQNIENIDLYYSSTGINKNLLNEFVGKPGEWIVTAPEGANYTKTDSNDGYQTHVTFDSVSGWEMLNAPEPISLEIGKVYTLSCYYNVGKAFTNSPFNNGFGVVLRTDSGTHASQDTSFNSIGTLNFSMIPGIYFGSYTFTATVDTIYLCLNGGNLNDGQTGLNFDLYCLKLEHGNKATPWTWLSNADNFEGSLNINLQNHPLRSLPNGICDILTIDNAGNIILKQYIGMTEQATTDGISATIGTNAISSTGTLDDGATVIYALASPISINIGTLDLTGLSLNNITWIETNISSMSQEDDNNTFCIDNIVYANEEKELSLHAYSAKAWNDNTIPLSGTTSAHILDITHSALSGFYFKVSDGTVIQRIEKIYTYDGGSFTDSVSNEVWNISEGNTVNDETLILQGGNA